MGKASIQPAADGVVESGGVHRAQLELPGRVGHRVAVEGGERDLGGLGARVVETERAAPGAMVDDDRVRGDEHPLRQKRRGEGGQEQGDEGSGHWMVTVRMMVAT